MDTLDSVWDYTSLQTKYTKRAIVFSLVSWSFSLAFLVAYLIVLHTGVINLESLASGAILIHLTGNCASKQNGTCVGTVINEFKSCNGPLSCPGKIASMWSLSTQVIGIVPSGITHNDTTFTNVFNDVFHNSQHYNAMIVLCAGQLIGWASIIVNQTLSKKYISAFVYMLTFFVTFVAYYMNYRGILYDLTLNLDHPPTFLLRSITELPVFIFVICTLGAMSSIVLLTR